MHVFVTILALLATLANAQVTPAMVECSNKISTGFSAASTACGIPLTFDAMNVTGSVSSDPVAYTAYLDKVCSTVCVNAVSKAIQDSSPSCKSYPILGNTSIADWNVISWSFKFNFACLKQGSEYCIVKQIKASKAAGQTFPNYGYLPSDRPDLCMPCLKNQTDYVVEYYKANGKAVGFEASILEMSESGTRMLYNSCPANTTTSADVMSNVQLFMVSYGSKVVVSGLVAVLFAVTILV